MQRPEVIGIVEQAAVKYGRNAFVRDFESMATSLSDDQLRELSALYDLIARREDKMVISDWIDSCRNASASNYRDKKLADAVVRLLILFEYLGERNIHPFNNGLVRYISVLEKPNWDNVPPDLRYLIDAAQRYSHLSSEIDMIEFLEKASDEDMSYLRMIADRMRSSGDWIRAQEWIKLFPFPKHQESWQIYWFISLLDHAGLNFEGPQEE